MFHVKPEDAGPQRVVVPKQAVFRDEWQQQLTEYHDILADTGVAHGLIGPREGPRLWTRHLDNCAVIAVPELGLLPRNASVVDIGSGAGLPGVVWALTRPDLRVHLIEPLLRRAQFLTDVIAELDLTERVVVTRARAEDVPPQSADVVTSRAVAALPQLIAWSLRHTAPDGSVLAIKGGRASEELSAEREKIRRLGGSNSEVVEIVVEPESEPTARLVVVSRKPIRRFEWSR
ncbi:MAG: rRNA (guanine527-N7)-methyltransferase [Actinomycetota bacterium]|jgi:16S rRNA (guanine527-N7)-methyltransferase|nr:rRNA (guanine527-N7)-methyltransferase [Actinomycetota bacterium]